MTSIAFWGMGPGVDILANGTQSALNVAHATSADFVRKKLFVGAAVVSEGMMQSSAWQALEFCRSTCRTILRAILLPHSPPPAAHHTRAPAR